MPPSYRSSASLTLVILIFLLFLFLAASCLTPLLLGAVVIDGSWRSFLAVIGVGAVLATAALAVAVGALAMWFQLKVRAPEPPHTSSPSGPEPSKAFSEDAAHPSRRRKKKPPPTDETLDL